MSEFILNRDWNVHSKGDIVKVPDHLDGQMVRNRIGWRTDKVKMVEVSPENKAILNSPKKKRNVRSK